MKAKIIRILKIAQYHWHRKVLRDDFLYPVDDDFDEMLNKLVEADPFTGEPLENEPFTLTEDMIWCPKAKKLSPEEIKYLLTFTIDDDEEVLI